jgi:hypothetical protein
MATRAITSFSGAYRWPSNFRPAPGRMSGITYPSTEPHRHDHRHGHHAILDAMPGPILEARVTSPPARHGRDKPPKMADSLGFRRQVKLQ